MNKLTSNLLLLKLPGLQVKKKKNPQAMAFVKNKLYCLFYFKRCLFII